MIVLRGAGGAFRISTGLRGRAPGLYGMADVLSEDYMYARQGDDATPQAVARLRFRAARKHLQDLSSLLARFSGLTPLPLH